MSTCVMDYSGGVECAERRARLDEFCNAVILCLDPELSDEERNAHIKRRVEELQEPRAKAAGV